jgi:hypothetical protein
VFAVNRARAAEQGLIGVLAGRTREQTSPRESSNHGCVLERMRRGVRFRA